MTVVVSDGLKIGKINGVGSWKGKVERRKGKVEGDYKAASDFSPGIYGCMSAVEELERKKEKRERKKGLQLNDF
jgi:hypothetical protein